MDDKTRHPGGRPPTGASSKTKARTIRLEPYVDEELVIVCRYLGITPTDAIREGIRLFLAEARKTLTYRY